MNGMSIIVRTVTKFIGGMILLFGIYLTLHGHLAPGEGFAGGVIIASALVLITLTYGNSTTQKILPLHTAQSGMAGGALFILAISLAGFFSGSWFANFLPCGVPFTLLSGGITPLINIGIATLVASGLYLALISLFCYRIKME